MKLPTNPVFYERYANFRNYGYGLMLVYWTGYSLEYVLFTDFDTNKKTVISKELLEQYKKEKSNAEESLQG